MEPGQNELGEKAEDPLKKVQGFITRVWEHPLLDEQTRQHRADAKDAGTLFCMAHGLKLKDTILIPTGSALWSTTPNSDFDFLLITLQQLREADEDRIIGGGKIQDIEAPDVSSKAKLLWNPMRAIAMHLFLTPDDYLVGNIEAARSLRLELLKIVSDGEETEEWEERLEEDFKSHLFTEWGRDDFEGLDTKRVIRFQKKVEEKASERQNPEGWKNGFLKALDTINPPSFENYQDALNQTNGALQLLTPIKVGK